MNEADWVRIKGGDERIGKAVQPDPVPTNCDSEGPIKLLFHLRIGAATLACVLEWIRSSVVAPRIPGLARSVADPCSSVQDGDEERPGVEEVDEENVGEVGRKSSWEDRK